MFFLGIRFGIHLTLLKIVCISVNICTKPNDAQYNFKKSKNDATLH
jgi:hypothetical protein